MMLKIGAWGGAKGRVVRAVLRAGIMGSGGGWSRAACMAQPCRFAQFHIERDG
jgi:hypothetical protein